MHYSRVKYEPIQVKDLLIKMKNFAELMVYLAYCSVMYGDSKLAKEVMRLEKYVDYLSLQLLIHASLATRNVEDAISMLSIFKAASAMDKISDAAADIASVALDSKPSLVGRVILGLGEEIVSRIKIRKNSRLIGLTLKEVFEKIGFIFDVLAIRRDEHWFLEPSPTFRLDVDDAIIVRGHQVGLNSLKREALDVQEKERIEVPSKYSVILMALKELRDVSDLMVDLACSALATGSRKIAEIIIDLENYVDGLYISYEQKVLKSKEFDINDMLKFVRIAVATENIADAANEIAEVILRGATPHPILVSVFREAEERIIDVKVNEILANKRLGELELEKIGAIVLAVQHEDKWLIKPRSDFKLQYGDTLIVRCYAEAEEKLLEILRGS